MKSTKEESDDSSAEAHKLERTSDGLVQERCDLGGCEPGYGARDGICVSCDVRDCISCERRGKATPGVCTACRHGYGLGSNGTCQKCAHEKCQCEKAGGCDSCSVGWGLNKNRTCRACEEGCLDCSFVNSSSCDQCEPGFVIVQEGKGEGGECKKCASHCSNCTVAGAGRCNECRPSFGYDSRVHECKPCSTAHCLLCDGTSEASLGRCLRCEHGFGVTPEGLCDKCGDVCENCDWAGKCTSCSPGYALLKGSCWSCADGCATCSRAGPAKCDQCLAGFRLRNSTGTCVVGHSFLDLEV
eukprot:gnl/TRDRNA2_/TRDRNA2_94410_c0_seq2.p1 gnl/TRDRNA2_/TRDRNA2_94410_c0~~gnl/TRDRNA2_/TRDRNA2_94410_c0_seq2.p1  ORF type:complete len:299 (-),score=28.52 gnl/TRDRNA2_/TRDRNA2_94410_c0_seq2:243-1139(-)